MQEYANLDIYSLIAYRSFEVKKKFPDRHQELYKEKGFSVYNFVFYINNISTFEEFQNLVDYSLVWDLTPEGHYWWDDVWYGINREISHDFKKKPMFFLVKLEILLLNEIFKKRP